MSEESPWWASTSAASPMVAHILEGAINPFYVVEEVGPCRALCGDWRRRWRLRERFAVPDAFEQCAICAVKRRLRDPEVEERLRQIHKQIEGTGDG